MSILRDGQFNKRRTILGIRVLVREEANGTGLIPDNFLIRIKHPDGDINAEIRTCYYWQAFNYAKTLMGHS